MTPPQHIEKHFRASETVRDIVIGMSDGLTVPREMRDSPTIVRTTRAVTTATAIPVRAAMLRTN